MKGPVPVKRVIDYNMKVRVNPAPVGAPMPGVVASVAVTPLMVEFEQADRVPRQRPRCQAEFLWQRSLSTR